MVRLSFLEPFSSRRSTIARHTPQTLLGISLERGFMVFVHCLCETYPHYSTGVPFGFPLQPPTRSGKTLPSLDSTCVIVLTLLETLTCLVHGGKCNVPEPTAHGCLPALLAFACHCQRAHMSCMSESQKGKAPLWDGLGRNPEEQPFWGEGQYFLIDPSWFCKPNHVQSSQANLARDFYTR